MRWPVLRALAGPRVWGLAAGDEMDLRLLALCSIEDVNWNAVAREALRAGGLARLLGGEVAETSRDGEVAVELA